MRLYLVRHGKAEGHTGNDHDRQLTSDGAKRLETEAQVIARLGINPDRIYSSPRVRARQTADIIARVLDKQVEISEEVNFGFTTESVTKLVNGLPLDAEVMFVGHNPSMAQVVHTLTGANVEMKVGSLARIDLHSLPPDLHGYLVWLIAPKVFDAISLYQS
jgi:phosphohistidine phosphatase